MRAENSLRQAVELAQRLGIASYERFMATGYLAYNLAEQNRLDEARQLVESALWSYTGNLDTYDVYVCRSVLADIALEKDNLLEAERLYRPLIQTGVKHQFRIPLAMVYFGLAFIYLKTGRENIIHQTATPTKVALMAEEVSAKPHCSGDIIQRRLIARKSPPPRYPKE